MFKKIFLALSNVVSFSLNEDRYGIVQKDLKQVISMLTTLSIAIDAFVRSTKVNFFKHLIFFLNKKFVFLVGNG